MNLILNRIEELNCSWNISPLSAEDLYRLCSEHGVEVIEGPLEISGFYFSVLGRHVIAVDSRLEPCRKLFVMFHEFAHFLFHSHKGAAAASFHEVGRKCRKEREADMFALCALIPKPLLAARSPAELIEGEGFPASMVYDRLELFRTLGI